MESVLSAFKVAALGATVVNMIVQIFTIKKDTETQKLARDVNALMFLVIYLVLYQF